MNIDIPTSQEIKEVVQLAVKEALSEMVPSIVERTQKKKFLTRYEVLDLLNISSPTLQRMRNERRIPFVRDGRKIVYPYEGIMQYIERHHIKSR